MNWKIDDEWQMRAACGGEDPSIFHDLQTATQRHRAQQICAACPVRESCLEHVLCSPWEPFGIWAGRSRVELKKMWRERHPSTSATERFREMIDLIGVVA